MSKELLVIKDDNIFSKIKKFFLKLFNKKNKVQFEEEIQEEVKEETIEEIEVDSSCEGRLQVNVNTDELLKEIKREMFIKEIESDDTILDNLSVDKLKKLEKYYEKRIEEKKETLKRLQAN